MTAVAIDGPAGAGKSTIARSVAKELGFIYVDTGALYRAIGLHALQNGADPKVQEQVKPLLSGLTVRLCFVDGEQRVLLNGEDVSEQIRTPEVSMAASGVSALKSVREFLFELQRSMAKENDVVMDGRDIGTVVLPNAQVKIFLTATPKSAQGGATGSFWKKERRFPTGKSLPIYRNGITTIPTGPSRP